MVLAGANGLGPSMMGSPFNSMSPFSGGLFGGPLYSLMSSMLNPYQAWDPSMYGYGYEDEEQLYNAYAQGIIDTMQFMQMMQMMQGYGGGRSRRRCGLFRGMRPRMSMMGGGIFGGIGSLGGGIGGFYGSSRI